MEHKHKLSLKSALDFIFGGNSTFTIVSKATNDRYTFKIEKGKKDGSPFFVKYLYGGDNNSSYKCFGIIPTEGDNSYQFFLTKGGGVKKDSTLNKAFVWMYKVLKTQNQSKFDLIEFWHEGKCGQCGRKLTVPSSIETGFGPVCSKNGKSNERVKIRENAIDFILNS